jgi:predicted enzyme related to lactoylglutathione lyase
VTAPLVERLAMPIHDGPWPDGIPCWVELAAEDLDAARLFYEGLFGWSMQQEPADSGEYLRCVKDGRAAAGITRKVAPAAPTAWTIYLATSDVDSAASKVTVGGGQVVIPAMDVRDLGRLAICMDPSGATFGLWQAGAHPGAAVVNEPGAFIWSEQMSDSCEPVKDFYAAVFDWQYHDMSAEGFRYATFVVDDRDIGGVGEYQDDAQSSAQWWVYFAVDDTDAAVDRVVKLGGDVLRPPSDTPYGRMATVTDDHGARFSLMAAPPEGYGDY